LLTTQSPQFLGAARQAFKLCVENLEKCLQPILAANYEIYVSGVSENHDKRQNDVVQVNDLVEVEAVALQEGRQRPAQGQNVERQKCEAIALVEQRFAAISGHQLAVDYYRS